MGLDWDDIPQWRKEGRTGPGPAAPRYASRKDRSKVRRGKPVGKDQFGHGGSRRIPASKIKKSQQGGSHKKKGCCSIAAGIRSIKDGNLRLGMRYFRMTPRFIARRFA